MPAFETAFFGTFWSRGAKNLDFMAEIGILERKRPKNFGFSKNYGGNGNFSSLNRKLMKYTCFRNFRKIAILRGSKLSRYSIFFRSDFTVEKISTYIFICQNFIPIRSIVFELWASQNRDFSTFSKTRVFYQLSRIAILRFLRFWNAQSSAAIQFFSILIEDSWFFRRQK